VIIIASKPVGIFFFVNGRYLFHGCGLDSAERYGKFLIYPAGHFDVWEKYHSRRYRVDYDYYPRGRVAYDTEAKIYRILTDCCTASTLDRLVALYDGESCTVDFDEHYKCQHCNPFYVI